MSSRQVQKAEETIAVVAGLLAIFALKLVGLGITGLVCGITLRYTVNHWLMYADRAPVFPYYIGFLLGLVPYARGKFAGLCVLSCLGTYIALLFL